MNNNLICLLLCISSYILFILFFGFFGFLDFNYSVTMGLAFLFLLQFTIIFSLFWNFVEDYKDCKKRLEETDEFIKYLESEGLINGKIQNKKES